MLLVCFSHRFQPPSVRFLSLQHFLETLFTLSHAQAHTDSFTDLCLQCHRFHSLTPILRVDTASLLEEQIKNQPLFHSQMLAVVDAASAINHDI